MEVSWRRRFQSSPTKSSFQEEVFTKKYVFLGSDISLRVFKKKSKSPRVGILLRYFYINEFSLISICGGGLKDFCPPKGVGTVATSCPKEIGTFPHFELFSTCVSRNQIFTQIMMLTNFQKSRDQSFY